MRGSGSAPARTARRSDHRPAQKTARAPCDLAAAVGLAQPDRARRGRDARDLPAEAQLAAGRAHVVGQLRADGPEVDDPGVRRVQRRDARRVRLDLAQAVGVQPPHARHAVGVRAPLDLGERRQLAVAEGDDELADAVDRDAVALAVRVHPRGAVDAQLGLQRAGRVVDAGMDHAAVVTGLMRRGRGLALDDEHARSLPAARPREDLARHCEPDDARPNDDGVVAVAGHPYDEVSPKSGNDADARGRSLLVGNLLREGHRFRSAFAGRARPKTRYVREPPFPAPCSGPSPRALIPQRF